MDMIKVYEATETSFANNGLKIIHPIKAEVYKEDNGDYYCDFQDDISQIDWYKQGMIARVPTRWGEQGFRMGNPVVRNNRVECRAFHLSYDAKNYIVRDNYIVDATCNSTLNYFQSVADTSSPFTFSSDITTILSTRAIRKSLLEIVQWMASDEKYGGHINRDNWSIAINGRIGQDRQIVIAYGKNLMDYESTEEWDDVCTKILPYTTDGDVAIETDDYYEITGMYDIPYTRVVEFKNELNKDDYETHEEFVEAIKDWLESKANEYLEINKVPKVNYKVTACIDNVSDVGDTIYVKHPKLKRDDDYIVTNVISLTYDAIADKYIQMEFGNFKKEVKNLVETITQSAVEETEVMVNESSNFLTNALNEATARINDVMGKSFVIYDGDQILVVDRLPKETATNVIKISSGGIAFSHDGINPESFNTAWTMDGELDMQYINTLNLTADFIKGGTLELGGAEHNGNLVLLDSGNRELARVDTDGIRVTAQNGDYVKLNAEYGFVGYNANGQKIYWADGDVFHMTSAEISNTIKIANRVQIVPVNTATDTGIGFVAIGGSN